MTSALWFLILRKRNSADRRSILDMTTMIWCQRQACFHWLDWFDSLTTPLSAIITETLISGILFIYQPNAFFSLLLIPLGLWHLAASPHSVQLHLFFSPRLRLCVPSHILFHEAHWQQSSFWFIYYEHLWVCNCQCLLVATARRQQYLLWLLSLFFFSIKKMLTLSFDRLICI